MGLNRRNFIYGGTLGLIGVSASAGVPGYQKETTPASNFCQNASFNNEDLRYDVVVVGAGASGIPAAIAAAREGANVILVEEDAFPGGAPVDYFVTFLCGNPRVGIFREIIQQLNSEHSLTGKPDPTFGKDGNNGKNHWWHPTSYIQVLSQLIAREENLKLMCGAQVIESIIETSGTVNYVRGIRIIRNGTLQNIYGSVIIDATGSGFVSAMSGCEVMYGNNSRSDFNESIGMDVSDGKVQPSTLMFIAQRIRKDAEFPIDELIGSSGLEDQQTEWMLKGKHDELVKRDSGIYLFWGKTVQVKNTCDPVEIGGATQEAVFKLEHNIRVINRAGFSVQLAPKLGIRESRRIRGDYVMTVDDILNGIFPSDTIAEGHYGVDTWGFKLPKSVSHVPPYGIPYRSLLPVNTRHLLTAGRIISGTKLAQGSYRVQPVCAGIGQAAGTAAAMACSQGVDVREIAVDKLQEKLKNDGLFELNPVFKQQ